MNKRKKSRPKTYNHDSGSKPTVAHRRGRPRASDTGSSEDPAHDIISAAALLFAQNGYAGTTTGQIARKAGLQQSSLYYYFSNKSEILTALIYPLTRMQIEFLNCMRQIDRKAASKLWRFIEFDVETLKNAPVNITEILSTGSDADFNVFWHERDELTVGVEELLREGIREGDLIDMDTNIAAHSLICFSEGVQSWFHDQRFPQKKTPQSRPPDTPAVADFLAEWLIKGLLSEDTDKELIRNQAKLVQKELSTLMDQKIDY